MMGQSEDAHTDTPPSSPQRIGVYEARTRWYELLRRAKAGEVFIITYRGVPKAELGPIPPDHPIFRKLDDRQPTGKS
jgi:antitoxin (DNA-binding transcriptional repressor) of toxin-antitoxin stability system